jgi:hypothetical protein
MGAVTSSPVKQVEQQTTSVQPVAADKVLGACKNIDDCKKYLIRDGIMRGEISRFDSDLQLILTHGDDRVKANVEAVLFKTLGSDTSASSSPFMSINKFYFERGINRLPVAEKIQRVHAWVAAGWRTMIQYALMFGFFDNLNFEDNDLQKVRDPTIHEMLQAQMATRTLREIGAKKCAEMPHDELQNVDVEVVDIPIARLKLRKNTWVPFDPRVLDDDKPQWDSSTIAVAIGHAAPEFFTGIESGIQPSLDLDSDWFDRSNKYLMALSLRDVYTIQSYSWHGDVIANRYLLEYADNDDELAPDYISYLHEDVNPKTIPFFFQLLEIWPKFFDEEIPTPLSAAYVWLVNRLKGDEIEDEKFWRAVIRQYVADIERIIKAAPSPKREMTVFRGTKTHYYSNKLGEIFSNATFTSTSYMATVTQSFANYAGGCCLSVYKLKPGVHCIWMDPISHVTDVGSVFGGFGEAEVLLAPGNKFKIASKRVINFNKNPSWFVEGDVNEEEIQKWGLKINEDSRKNKFARQDVLCPGGKMTAYDTTIFEQV